MCNLSGLRRKYRVTSGVIGCYLRMFISGNTIYSGQDGLIKRMSFASQVGESCQDASVSQATHSHVVTSQADDVSSANDVKSWAEVEEMCFALFRIRRMEEHRLGLTDRTSTKTRLQKHSSFNRISSCFHVLLLQEYYLINDNRV